MMGDGKVFLFEQAKREAADTLSAHGVPKEDALTVADCLATAELYGVTSHGLSMLPAYTDRIRRGGFNLEPHISVLRETAAFAVIDGDNALGPVSADFCMRYAIERCRDAGIFTVFSRNNNTLGPTFYYPLQAAKENLIGFVCSNSPAQMAPFGGCEKMLGTNPFSMVIPVPNGEPLIVDMATSVAAKSKFSEYKKENRQLPEGWALDVNGKPTTDPDEAIQGSVLPMAGFKGYGISILIDITSGVLSGSAFLNHVGRFYSEKNDSMNVGFYIMAIDPKLVLGDEYAKTIYSYINEIKNSKALPGSKIVIPGDNRQEIRRAHEKNWNIFGKIQTIEGHTE